MPPSTSVTLLKPLLRHQRRRLPTSIPGAAVDDVPLALVEGVDLIGEVGRVEVDVLGTGDVARRELLGRAHVEQRHAAGVDQRLRLLRRDEHDRGRLPGHGRRTVAAPSVDELPHPASATAASATSTSCSTRAAADRFRERSRRRIVLRRDPGGARARPARRASPGAPRSCASPAGARCRNGVVQYIVPLDGHLGISFPAGVSTAFYAVQ